MAGSTETGQSWNDEELRFLVSDYFEMLQAELGDEKYSKSEHRRKLQPLLVGRSEGAIEFKHQNLSAVLVELGLPYIEGYKPLGNKQFALGIAVENYLEDNPNLLQRLAASPVLNPKRSPVIDLSFASRLVVDPPESMVMPKLTKPWITRKPRRIDFVERDILNRTLGAEAEKFIVEFEKHRLISLGRDDLAQKVVWASRDIGDGLGFDIISFNDVDGSERLLEVKATGLGKSFPFYVTGNEVRCSEDVPQQYQLYRVFNFSRTPNLYILHGSLRKVCQLDPVLFRATI